MIQMKIQYFLKTWILLHSILNLHRLIKYVSLVFIQSGANKQKDRDRFRQVFKDPVQY